MFDLRQNYYDVSYAAYIAVKALQVPHTGKTFMLDTVLISEEGILHDQGAITRAGELVEA